MENFWCEIEEKVFIKGPCLHEKGGTQKGNKTCPECTYWVKILYPTKQLKEARTSVSGKGTGKKTGTDAKDKYRKKSCSPKLDKSPIDRGCEELKQMKMSEYDRGMAIVRSKEYIKDKEAFLKFFVEEGDRPGSEEGIEFYRNLCKKWDSYLFPLSNDDAGVPLLDRPEGIQLVTVEEGARIRCGLEKYEKAHLPFMVKKGDNLFVQLQIDLSRSKKDLTKTFSKMVKSWKEIYFPKEIKKNSRKTKYDQWKIFDLHQSISLLEIARRYYGKRIPRKQRRPADNEKLWTPYKRVQRAYDQAKKMIKAVEENAHQRTIDLELRLFSYGRRRLDPRIRSKLMGQ